MNTPSNLFEQIGALRQGAIAVLDQLGTKAQEFDLPPPPATLQNYRRKLADNTYTVLVVGEAKRGKSTFVNALIGRNILPTDVDIATSQVFHVRQTEREAYRIRFEDESLQEISAADLPRYGSQVIADSAAIWRLGQVIRWIEVDTPMRFVPRGVVLLDTPGLGSLYAAHAQITYRFVSHADAVIFVLDSSKPIIQSELAFIDTILGVTRDVFFVQTKIDQYLKEQWQAILQRNQAILADHLKGRLTDTRIWPISSVNLMQAAQTGDDDYLLVSGHRELEQALETFLFRVAGLSRTAEARVVAENYHRLAATALSERLAGLTGQAGQKPVEQQAAERRAQFDAAWGEHGTKRRELLASIRKATTARKNGFLKTLQPSGEIEMAQRKAIDAVKSVEAAHRLGEAIPGEVVTAALARWRQISEETFAQCTVLLTPFLQAVDEMMFPFKTYQPLEMELGSGPILGIKDELWDKVQRAQDGFIDGTQTALAGVTILAYVIGASAILSMLPIAALGVVAIGIWGMMRGWQFAEREQVETAQEDLHKYLSTVLEEVRRRFLAPDPDYDNVSLAEKQFDALADALTEHIQTIATAKSEAARLEIARLEEMAQLDVAARTDKIKQIQQQLTEWETLGRAIQAIAVELRTLDHSLANTLHIGA